MFLMRSEKLKSRLKMKQNASRQFRDNRRGGAAASLNEGERASAYIQWAGK